MSTDSDRIALAIYRCSEKDWARTTLQDRFVSYDIENGEVLHSEEESAPAGKWAGDANATLTSLTLPVGSLVYQNLVLQAISELVHRHYDEYRRVSSGCNDASRKANANGVRLKELLEQQWICDQAADTEDVTKETSLWTWPRISRLWFAQCLLPRKAV